MKRRRPKNDDDESDNTEHKDEKKQNVLVSHAAAAPKTYATVYVSLKRVSVSSWSWLTAIFGAVVVNTDRCVTRVPIIGGTIEDKITKAYEYAMANAPKWTTWELAEATFVYDTGQVNPETYVVNEAGPFYEYTVLYGAFKDLRSGGGKDCRSGGCLKVTSRHPYYPGTDAFFHEVARLLVGPKYQTVGMPTINQVVARKL